MKLNIPKSGTHTIHPSTNGWALRPGAPDKDSIVTAYPRPIVSKDGDGYEVSGNVWIEPRNPKTAASVLIVDDQFLKNLQSSINSAIMTLFADGQFLLDLKITDQGDGVRVQYTSSNMDGALPNPLDSKGEGGTIA